MAQPARARVTFMLDVETIEKMRDMVYADPDQTMTGFAQEAVEAALAKYERKHGKIPQRKGKLRAGRPIS